MRFKCPHCNRWIELPPGRSSKKANAARKRNAQLAGRKPATPEDALEHVFLSKPGDAEPWTGEAFQKAVKNVAGYEYSRSRAFKLLAKLKKKFKHVAKWRKRQTRKASDVKYVGGLDAPSPLSADKEPFLKKLSKRASL